MNKHKQLNKTEKDFQQELQKAKEIQLGKFIVDQMSKNNPYFTAIEWNRHTGYLKVFFNKNIGEEDMLKACIFLSRMLSFLQTSIQNEVISCYPITWYKKEQMLVNPAGYEEKSRHHTSIDNDPCKQQFDFSKNKKDNYMYIPIFDLPKFIHKYALGIIKV